MGFHDMKRGGFVSDGRAPARPESGAAYRVQVLDRALRILDALAAEGQLAPSEISTRLALHKSTVHRLLAVLEQNEYVDRSQVSGRYSLGLKLIELGTRASSRLDICELAGPILDRLMEQTGETAHIGILSQGAAISVADSESYKTLRTPSTVGRRTPPHCSSQGKVLLAELNAAQLRAFVGSNGLKSFTRLTIRTISGLELELSKVRRDGYAIDDQEFEEGLKCIGAPIRDHAGSVVAALSIAGPAMRLRLARMPTLIESVVAAAVRLSTVLGYRPEPEPRA
jgi:IclR family KDG regulon transcriptional repressor